jgi:DNA-binding NtrC family response regulator
MLIRALLAIDDAGLRREARAAFDEAEAVVTELDARPRFWTEVAGETFDLVVATRPTLPEPFAASISEIRDLPDRPEVIVLSDEGDLDIRARLLASGALAVIPRSLSAARLGETLAALVRRRRTIAIATLRVDREVGHPALAAFAARSEVMKELLAVAEKAAPVASSLLFLGETGVGKEWLGRAVHAAGPRRDQPFVAVNPAALPEQLLESELFGHEKGAFTGATRARRGAFELAHGGTLFLDEIADMPAHLQVKLLRVLQERKIQRLGSETPIDVDVRLMAATNQDLDQAMNENRFRRDLFYRLSVVPLTVPPLRRRREDIPALVETYVDQFRTQLGKPQIAGTSVEAMRALETYEWPGNVRELANVIERAILLCEGELVTLAELPVAVSAALGEQSERAAPDVRSVVSSWRTKSLAEAREDVLADFERRYLEQLLRETRGRIGECAARAGIDPRTVYNKMKLYGLRKEDFRREG